MAKRANVIAGAVIAVVVVIAVVAMAAPRMTAPASGLRALVHDGDGDVHELSLARDSETVITTSFGTNVVVVEGGAVFVRDADCDNHDCIRQGSIDAPGRQIICLPHELWIEVVGADDAAGELDLDAAAGSEGVDVTSR